MLTQKQMILDHLHLHGKITPLEALSEYGCYRLSAVIFNLRDEGYPIVTNPLSRKNRFGKTVTFAEYTLEKGE